MQCAALEMQAMLGNTSILHACSVQDSRLAKDHHVCFWGMKKRKGVVMHGDDFTVLQAKTQIMRFRGELSKRFEAKLRWTFWLRSVGTKGNGNTE